MRESVSSRISRQMSGEFLQEKENGPVVTSGSHGETTPSPQEYDTTTFLKRPYKEIFILATDNRILLI